MFKPVEHEIRYTMRMNVEGHFLIGPDLIDRLFREHEAAS